MGLSESLPAKLNADEKDQLRIGGYRPHLAKCIATIAAMVLSFGFLSIILIWRKDLKMKMMYQQCDLRVATKILVKVPLKVSSLNDADWFNFMSQRWNAC